MGKPKILEEVDTLKSNQTNVMLSLAEKMNKEIVDDTTGKKYVLGINNGLLYFKEVIV